MKRANKLTYALAAIAALLVLITLITLMTSGIKVYAAETLYTSALEDLQRDSSFDFEAYPVDDKDYSLNVIQIAESSDGELFVYVYQPCARKYDLRASSINIARKPNDSINLHYDNYKLTFLNSAGVFYKYKAEEFEILESIIRHYNISNILRPFERLLDDPAENDNNINEVANVVGQLWTVTTGADNKISYSCIDSEVIKITQKYVGFLNLLDGASVDWNTSITATSTLRNFVAFSTDHQIDDLRQVELKYSLQDISCNVCLFKDGLCGKHNQYERYNIRKGEVVPQKPVIINADETESNNKHGLYGHKYTWKKIISTEDFFKDDANKGYKLNNGSEAEFKKTQWVLSFYSDKHTVKNSNAFDFHADESYKAVSEVIILRLMFETAGTPYNLGVVDNKQTGSGNQANIPEEIDIIPWWVWLLIAVGVVAVVLILICIFVPGAAPAIGRGILLIGKGIIFGIYYLFYGLFWVISAPFRLIAKAIKNRKAKPKKPANKSRAKNKTRKKAGKKK